MRFDRWTILIGTAAVAVALLLGALSGALPGAIAGLAGLLSAALWQAAANHRDKVQGASDMLRLAEQDLAPLHWAAESPSMYLLAEAEVVSFWPRKELQTLSDWLVSADRSSMRLAIGPGGAGKTRLALELTSKAAGQHGWRCYWVRARHEQQAASAIRHRQGPVLLVVDYAETRAGLPELIAEVMEDTRAPPIRVLMLARSAGEWWQQLIASCDMPGSDALATVTPLSLGPLTEPPGQAEVFGQALKAFAAKLGRELPAAPAPAIEAGAVVLVVHAAALLTVLEQDARAAADARASPANDPAEVIKRLLRHETRYWQHSQASYGLSLGPALSRRVVAAGALIGADDEVSAMRLLAAVDELADPELRGKTARWLHDLYPAAKRDAEWIGALRPDIVAERLIVDVLTELPALTTALMTGLRGPRARRALTVLARAALTNPAAVVVLRAALGADLAHLAEPALTVAMETNSLVGDLLAEALSSQAIPLELAERIRRALPERSVALAETAAAVLQMLVDASAGETERHGTDLDDLSFRLAELGRRDEALAAAGQAVVIYRKLARQQPAAFTADLSRSLNDQSNRLADCGHLEEALGLMDEAVAIRRQLAEQQPDAFLPDLAASLNNQSVRLADLGRREDALAVIEEAVAIRRRLADQQPDTFRPVLALSLNNYSNRLGDLKRHEDALAAIGQAVEIRRQLARQRPDEFLPDLALALNNLAVHLYNLGRYQEGLAAITDAVTAYRQLAEYQRDTFLQQLTAALNNQSGFLAKLGNREQALAVATEAVAIRRGLAEKLPGTFLPDLAIALSTQALRLADSGQPEQAVTVNAEAISIFRALAAERAERFLPPLANCLEDQSRRLLALGRFNDALATADEAVTIWRKLAAERPAVFSSRLQSSLAAMAAVRTSMGRAGTYGHESQ